MAKHEIDEAELTQLRRAHALIEKLAGSPKSRRHFERAVKEEFPDVRTQEEEAEDMARPYVAKVEETANELKKELEALREEKRKQAEEAADSALYSSFIRLKDQGYTDEGMQKIAAIMKERNIADPEAAAALYDRLNPRQAEPAPSSWEPARWNIGDDAVGPDTKALFENPEKWADLETGKILTEIRSQHAA